MIQSRAVTAERPTKGKRSRGLDAPNRPGRGSTTDAPPPRALATKTKRGRGRPRQPPRTSTEALAVAAWKPRAEILSAAGILKDNVLDFGGPDSGERVADAEARGTERPAWIVEQYHRAVGRLRAEKFRLDGVKVDSAKKTITGQAVDGESYVMDLDDSLGGARRELARVETRARLFASTLPAWPAYRQFLVEVLTPIRNAAFTDRRWCVECGRKFALRNTEEIAKSRFCGDECYDRARKRGAARIGNGRSAADNAIHREVKRFETWARQHKKICRLCEPGAGCDVYVARRDALHVGVSQVSLDEPIDSGDDLDHRTRGDEVADVDEADRIDEADDAIDRSWAARRGRRE